MKFSNSFKILYWLILILFLTLYLLFRLKELLAGNNSNVDILVFIFWFSLLIFPLIKEINILGVSFKRGFEDVKREVRDSVNSLKMELKNNITFQPTINLNTEKANETEVEDKIKKESEEIEKKERLEIQRNDEEKSVPTKEHALARFNKIKKIEELVFKILINKYGDNFVSNLKIVNSLGKKVIADGAVFRGNKIVSIIEIKLISRKSFETFKYIGGRYLKKLISIGVKSPVKFIVVSEEMDEVNAYKIKKDISFIGFIKDFSVSCEIPFVSVEFYKLENDILTKIEPKAEENE